MPVPWHVVISALHCNQTDSMEINLTLLSCISVLQLHLWNSFAVVVKAWKRSLIFMNTRWICDPQVGIITRETIALFCVRRHFENRGLFWYTIRESKGGFWLVERQVGRVLDPNILGQSGLVMMHRRNGSLCRLELFGGNKKRGEGRGTWNAIVISALTTVKFLLSFSMLRRNDPILVSSLLERLANSIQICFAICGLRLQSWSAVARFLVYRCELNLLLIFSVCW